MKKTSGEKKISIYQAQGPRCSSFIVVPSFVPPCVPVTVAFSTSTKPYDPCPL